MISLGFFDQSEHRHRIVGSGLQAFPNERSAGIGAFAGHPCELWKPFIEQPFSMIDRRVSASSASCWIFLFCFCFCYLFSGTRHRYGSVTLVTLTFSVTPHPFGGRFIHRIGLVLASRPVVRSKTNFSLIDKTGSAEPSHILCGLRRLDAKAERDDLDRWQSSGVLRRDAKKRHPDPAHRFRQQQDFRIVDDVVVDPKPTAHTFAPIASASLPARSISRSRLTFPW